MKREQMLAALAAREAGRQRWDVVVIGGGATGVGVALDASSRGYRVALCEREDFGSATSSRSTKLIHGGVRYLEQGNLALVREALRERGLLRQNAPHLVRELAFVVPSYAWWETPFYATGLKFYDWMAGAYGFAPSRRLSAAAALKLVPTLNPERLRGGVLYHDAQFDDARLLLAMAATAAEQGATLVNYASVIEISKDQHGRVDGVTVLERESGQRFRLSAKAVVNATGIFADQTRRLAEPAAARLLRPSQGVHLVFDRSFLPGEAALLVPHTRDGRVLFAIPWQQHTLVGTTDTPVDEPSYQPRPEAAEIDFILQTAGRYLSRPPQRRDVLSVFTGIRPLVERKYGAKSASRSREHALVIEPSGLITITGGKWTTYRLMAEQTVDAAVRAGGLRPVPCRTRSLHLHGYQEPPGNDALAAYGADAAGVRALAASDARWAQRLHAAAPVTGAQVVWAAPQEMARTLQDVLARRTRALFLDARAALAAAPAAAQILAAELGRNEAWSDEQVLAFERVAREFSIQTWNQEEMQCGNGSGVN